MYASQEMTEIRKGPAHLTVPSEAVYGLMHSSSTGDLYTSDLYTTTLPSSPLCVDMLSSDSDRPAGETVLLGQQMHRCADSLVALRMLFMLDDPQGEWIISLFVTFTVSFRTV